MIDNKFYIIIVRHGQRMDDNPEDRKKVTVEHDPQLTEKGF